MKRNKVMKLFTRIILSLLTSGVCLAAGPTGDLAGNVTGTERQIVGPTPEQAAWQDDEVSMFFHFDITVLTDGGRGSSINWPSHLDPDIFNPAKLDADQWMEAAKAMGAKPAVFVAKHCPGFILWQSDAYPYGLKQT